MTTQNEAVLDYMQSGHKISALKALEYFGIFRLAARINDLREAGHLINSQSIKVNTRIGKTVVSEYSMITEKGQMELI